MVLVLFLWRSYRTVETYRKQSTDNRQSLLASHVALNILLKNQKCFVKLSWFQILPSYKLFCANHIWLKSLGYR